MIKYKIQFSNRLQEDYYVFLDKKSYVGDITNITGAADVFTIRSLNNDDDRFSPIISKECNLSIRILKGELLTIADFLASEEDEWRVIVKRELELPPIFDGYLLVEDSNQPLVQPGDAPFNLQLRASDGLPLLKGVNLKMVDDTVFRNLNPITDYIGHILYVVNPNISFRVYTDIYHISMDETVCSLEQTSISALTFKKDGGGFEDCYTVLEAILSSLGMRLFYENGYWNLVNIAQYKNSAGFNWHEYKLIDGLVQHQDSLNHELLIAKIGKSEVIQAINKDATIYYKVATKSVKKTFTYQIPKELICNQELKEGTKVPSESTPTSDSFTPDCFLSSRSPIAVVATEKDFFITTQFDEYSYEKDRYLRIPKEIVTTYIHSSRFYVHEKDDISFSVDVKVLAPEVTNNIGVYYVLLRGDDGTIWVISDDQSPNGSELFWQQTSITNLHPVRIDIPAGQAKEWTTVTAQPTRANPDNGRKTVPVNGEIQLILIQINQGNPFITNETHFKNIEINYDPYIKNSYRPTLGDYNIYDQNKNKSRTIDEQVRISDSPKNIIRGALFIEDTLATPEWYRLGRTESLRFMQLQTLIKYNFHFRQFHKVEGTLKGLSLFNASDTNIPFGFLPQYSLSDIPNSPKYILTSITDCNYLEGQWRGVIVEIPAEEPVFDTYDFQYIFK